MNKTSHADMEISDDGHVDHDGDGHHDKDHHDYHDKDHDDGYHDDGHHNDGHHANDHANDHANYSDNDSGGGGVSPPSTAPATAARRTLAEKRERLAIAIKRAELETAKAGLEGAQKRRLLAKKMQKQKRRKAEEEKEERQIQRQMAVDVPSRPPGARLEMLSALKTARIIISNISASGPKELVRIVPAEEPPPLPVVAIDDHDRAEDYHDNNERQLRSGELRQRQEELRKKHAALLKKAERLKKRQKLAEQAAPHSPAEAPQRTEDEGDETEELLRSDSKEPVAAEVMGKDVQNPTPMEGPVSARDRLRQRRLELQSTITRHAAMQQELKQTIELTDLREMVNKQRKILMQQGRRLTESTGLLKEGADEIMAEKEKLMEAEVNLEEKRKKKVMLERMARSVTDKLLERRRKRNELLQRQSDQDGDSESKSPCADASTKTRARKRTAKKQALDFF